MLMIEDYRGFGSRVEIQGLLSGLGFMAHQVLRRPPIYP